MEVIKLNIFLPDSSKLKTYGEYKGYAAFISSDVIGIYICDSYEQASVDFQEDDISPVYCRISKDGFVPSNVSKSGKYFLHISGQPEPITIAEFSYDNEDLTDRVAEATVIFYNYRSFLLSEDRCLENSDDSANKNRFVILKKIINMNEKNRLRSTKKSCDNNTQQTDENIFTLDNDNFYKNSSSLLTFLRRYSNLAVEVTDFSRFLYWIGASLYKDRKISVKTGNLILAIFVNLFCGIMVLYTIDTWCQMPLDNIFNSIESIVHNLQDLIKWLMGSPAGLKLNHAFNNMLGKFFIYHIDLWWMFLVTTKDVLELSFEVFKLLGWLGITFQTAILADLLSLASFHALCIYTYAARLYNIQISAIIALWRLFLGKKHNPLRGGVDSCEYTHHQLFVGTILFTILLFLLPTTALYYVVFTAFRILFVLLGGILSKLTYTIQSLPVYLLILWIFKSPKIAGSIQISLVDEISFSRNKINCIRVHLNTSSFFHLMKIYVPTPISEPEKIEWKILLSSLVKGKLIYPV